LIGADTAMSDTSNRNPMVREFFRRAVTEDADRNTEGVYLGDFYRRRLEDPFAEVDLLLTGAGGALGKTYPIGGDYVETEHLSFIVSALIVALRSEMGAEKRRRLVATLEHMAEVLADDFEEADLQTWLAAVFDDDSGAGYRRHLRECAPAEDREARETLDAIREIEKRDPALGRELVEALLAKDLARVGRALGMDTTPEPAEVTQ
jgi:hypothetical protein